MLLWLPRVILPWNTSPAASSQLTTGLGRVRRPMGVFPVGSAAAMLGLLLSLKLAMLARLVVSQPKLLKI